VTGSWACRLSVASDTTCAAHLIAAAYTD